MDKTYIVKTTSQAEKELHEIIHYIAHELKAPDAALHLLDALEDSFASLACFPQRVALIDEEPWHTNGIRRLTVKNFNVYFWIDGTRRLASGCLKLKGRRLGDGALYSRQ